MPSMPSHCGSAAGKAPSPIRVDVMGKPVIFASSRNRWLASVPELRFVIETIRAAHESLEAGHETEERYRVAGRLHARRGQGGAAFLDLDDRSGRIQLHATRDTLGEESFDALTSLDLGDVIGAWGFAFKTRRGELSLRVEGCELLAKSLRPPPDKFHGLEDVETRYRHRELDLIANAEARDLFIMRSRVVSATRNWLDSRGFLCRRVND